MKTFREFISESNIEDLKKKLKETSDEDSRQAIQKQIDAAKSAQKS